MAIMIGRTINREPESVPESLSESWNVGAEQVEPLCVITSGYKKRRHER
jgi:hypothetical protein